MFCFGSQSIARFINTNASTLKLNFQTNLSYEPVKSLRYNIHCFDVMLIFQINADNTYIHD